MRKQKSASVKVLRRDVAYEAALISPTKLDVNAILAIQFYHEYNQARRKQILTQQTKEMFKLTTSQKMSSSQKKLRAIEESFTLTIRIE
jgi:hypothetical protein